MLSVMSTAALGIGAYAGGYVCGKRQRRNGLLSGVLCGVFIFLIIVILSALFSKAAESFSVSAKLVLTLVLGIGFCCINSAFWQTVELVGSKPQFVGACCFKGVLTEFQSCCRKLCVKYSAHIFSRQDPV